MIEKYPGINMIDDRMPRCKDCTLGREFECGIVGLCDHCGKHAEKE
jgi:hypothetical protein